MKLLFNRVFDVGKDAGLGFGGAAELGFPVAVEDDPVDVAFAGIGLPAAGFAGGEVDVAAGAGAVVGVKEGFDVAAADEGLAYGVYDAFTGHIGKFLVHKLGGIGAACADEAFFKPFSGDVFKLAKKRQFDGFVGVAEFGFDEAFG